MNVLIAGNNSVTPDYMTDGIFHGFKKIFGNRAVDANRFWYLYRSENIFENGKNKPLHGEAFTYGGNLNTEEENVDRENLLDKVYNGYFDLVIVGVCRGDRPSERCNYKWEEILHVAQERQHPNNLIIIDGSDSQNFSRSDLIGCHPYFKRELAQRLVGVYPISFGIPMEKIDDGSRLARGEIKKEKILSANLPKDNRAGYCFNTEKEYYEDYQKSYFGLTRKKGGVDCMRHYEIIANNCLPYFIGVEDIPELTMANFPKDICLEIVRKYNLEQLTEKDIDMKEYHNYLTILRNHLVRYNTTVGVVLEMFNVLNKIKLEGLY